MEAEKKVRPRNDRLTHHFVRAVWKADILAHRWLKVYVGDIPRLARECGIRLTEKILVMTSQDGSKPSTIADSSSAIARVTTPPNESHNRGSDRSLTILYMDIA